MGIRQTLVQTPAPPLPSSTTLLIPVVFFLQNGQNWLKMRGKALAQQMIVIIAIIFTSSSNKHLLQPSRKLHFQVESSPEVISHCLPRLSPPWVLYCSTCVCLMVRRYGVLLKFCDKCQGRIGSFQASGGRRQLPWRASVADTLLFSAQRMLLWSCVPC